ncbi:hypothetical protein [Burkholderia pseudomallei]|uniref:hypothetical protein n=1 Tax=Burkholderia pseudomallei TaxID=28450 RepID=UPI0021F6D17D|nr:hypothetical protein [Burkholderia pseudomallei]MCW0014676.1 hypothetical protein [Burkholderia pseudomallei]
MPIDYTKRPKPAEEPSGQPAPQGGRISLTKTAPTVSLTKAASGGRLHVNLNWDARAAVPEAWWGDVCRSGYWCLTPASRR